MNFRIREFKFPDDYQEVFDLWENAGEGIQLRKSDKIEEIEKKLLRDPDLFLVAEIDEKISGAILGGFDGRRGMMYHLAVEDRYRKFGVASQLVSELESRLRAKGCVRYYLLVTKNNENAIKFYENRGWINMDDLLVYGKDLE